MQHVIMDFFISEIIIKCHNFNINRFNMLHDYCNCDF